MKYIKYIILSPDLIISIFISTILSFVVPVNIPSELTKDFYGIGISVLSIVFSVYFAALAIIMSSSDNDFIRFLEKKGRYRALILLFKYSLSVLFSALMISIAFYAYAAVEVYMKFKPQVCFLFLNKSLFIVFSFFFIYGLLAALSAVLDAIKYALTRADYINKIEAMNKNNEEK